MEEQKYAQENIEGSRYEVCYPKFVDSDEPLSVLQQKDLDNWVIANDNHPILEELSDLNREEYLNIQYGEDSLQNLSIYHLKGNERRPVIFYIHGGGWNAEMFPNQNYNSRYATPTWVKLGYTVVAINYRLAPKDMYPAQIDDCARALKWVIDHIQDYGGNPDKIAIAGESSGGHLSALLATGTRWHKKYSIDIEKVKCWISMAGILDFTLEENYYHPWMSQMMDAFLRSYDQKIDASPVMNVTGDEPPSLIIHGGDDWLVPKTNSVALYNKLKEKGAESELHILSGYWHCNTIVSYGEEKDEVTKVVNRFLETYLPLDSEF